MGKLNKDKGILDLIKVFENLIDYNFKKLYLFIIGPDEIKKNILMIQQNHLLD